MMIFYSALFNADAKSGTREPAVSGMFYPGNAEELKQMISDFLAEADQEVSGEIFGLVAPHAGYVYSGPVAAQAYRQIMNQSYDTVVVMAPSHFEPFRGISIFNGEFYKTPLGKIPLEKSIIEEITRKTAVARLSPKGHGSNPRGRGEHALEVQLPFLQTILDDFKLVPLIFADQDLETVKIISQSLAEILKNRNVLLVASSDLSHYYTYQQARSLDRRFLDHFTDLKYEEIIRGCEARRLEACGYGPVAALLLTGKLLGFTKSKVIHYATSGDVPTGEKSQVVGYMAGAVYR
ncbi:MAG: AmmeMemoRadiSam system protein B [Calditrichia bacterium]